MSFFVVIPAYNEEKYIAKVVKEVERYCEHIVVVDDGSKDATLHHAKETKAVVLRHLINLGKGAALRTGCEYALQQGARKIVVLDGDGQHKALDIPRFVDALENHDIVFSYRQKSSTMPIIFKFGNWCLSMLSAILFSMKIYDTQSGYRAFKAEAYKKIVWQSNSYSMESEMIANARKANLSYTQIPIETIYNERYKGTTVLDGLKIGFDMLLWRVKKR